jgi:hypothetical protein
MEQNTENSLFKTIMAAFMILFIHVLLLGSIAVLILFFYGIVNHLAWMILGFSCLCAGAYWFFRRFKSDGKMLKNIAGDSLNGKTVEVSFLGGIANFKISDSQTYEQLGSGSADSPEQLAAPSVENVKSLTELARLYEKNLITLNEYNKAKHKLFE